MSIFCRLLNTISGCVDWLDRFQGIANLKHRMSKDRPLCIPRPGGRGDFAEPLLNLLTRALPENRNGLTADVENGSS